ncbi:Amidase (plasmid) [Cupriavidus taiwanensis]|uniref:Amidase n=1 Tax=Cupriavidus taiwanensis TaxID=164546 RepID=A0A375EH91_9BURK|nr:amidase [Cupriavidus taiwanensis]SOZ71412.1 Amidase [Cupriavidus taiwanensis]SOZ72471.1 Amidase [Cupriavidus taiwanensis]SOZ74893.1 Amidase [Cupriavidus taiwanensis]SPA03338.1 Amidase [Cupriavidus taiwanensis]SPA57602.1 Amidase [Cupriavidus taiwanensis]
MNTPTIAEAATLIAARQLSPVELAEHCLSRIDAMDGTLHSFLGVTPERALQDAKAAEHRMMTGTLLGKLDGIPIAHKDNYCTSGIRTTAHSKLLRDWVPNVDAHIVSRLAQAGALSLGKLATHEFALGGPSFDLELPPACNPWKLAHFSSGSSSGTAVAVAAGLILGGTATDTSGSIRSPAALCGVTGIKPTYGLCSCTGILPLAFSLDHPGPIARTSEDCALLLQAMAGFDPTDPASVNRVVPNFTKRLGREIEGIRIGVAKDWHEVENRVSPAVQNSIEDALDVWRAQGAEIVEVKMPSLFDYQAAAQVIILCEAFAVHETWVRTRGDEYGEMLRDRLVLGGLMTGADYIQAIRRRHELCIATAQAAADVDVLITAGAPEEAPRIDGTQKWGGFSSPGFYDPFNITGWPAISLCSGYGEGDLPVSVQIAAKPFQEPLLFQVADAFEQATDFRTQRPSLASIPEETRAAAPL